LKELREAAGLSQETLADLAEISSAYVSQIETGRRNPPTPDVLRRMAGPLGVEYTMLLVAADYLNESDLLTLVTRALDSLYRQGTGRATLERAVREPINRWIAMSDAERREALARTDADDFAELLIEELLILQQRLVLAELFPDPDTWAFNE
jgi:transcriptional regulator with XRE-family HTH domain